MNRTYERDELCFFLNIEDLCMSMKPCLFLKIKTYVQPWPMLFHENREPMFDHNYAFFLKIKNLCVTSKQTQLYHTSCTEPPKSYKRKMHACIDLHRYKKMHLKSIPYLDGTVEHTQELHEKLSSP